MLSLDFQSNTMQCPADPKSELGSGIGECATMAIGRVIVVISILKQFAAKMKQILIDFWLSLHSRKCGNWLMCMDARLFIFSGKFVTVC